MVFLYLSFVKDLLIIHDTSAWLLAHRNGPYSVFQSNTQRLPVPPSTGGSGSPCTQESIQSAPFHHLRSSTVCWPPAAAPTLGHRGASSAQTCRKGAPEAPCSLRLHSWVPVARAPTLQLLFHSYWAREEDGKTRGLRLRQGHQWPVTVIGKPDK